MVMNLSYPPSRPAIVTELRRSAPAKVLSCTDAVILSITDHRGWAHPKCVGKQTHQHSRISVVLVFVRAVDLDISQLLARKSILTVSFEVRFNMAHFVHTMSHK